MKNPKKKVNSSSNLISAENKDIINYNIKKFELLRFFEKYGIVFIVLSCFIIYFQTLFFDIVYCDDVNIILREFERIKTLSNIPKEFMSGYIQTDYYRPIINISFIFDAWISGQSAFSYHLTNIIIHIAYCLLLYYLFQKLGFKKIFAVLAGLIYAVHPIFNNAVAWIVGRNDTIFSLFCIISFIFLLNYFEKKKIVYFILHLILFLLATLTKETSLAFPIVILSYILLIRKTKLFDKSNIYLAIGWIFVGAIWITLRTVADLGESVNRYGLDVILMNIRVFPEIIAKFFIPINLSVLPTYNALNTFLGVLLIVLLSFVIYKVKQKNIKFIMWGVSWFFLMLLPGVFVTVINSNDWNEYLECRSYLPLVGILIILSNLTNYKKLVEKRKTFNLVTLIVFVGFSLLSLSNIQNYKNALTFYENAIKNDPNKALFHEILGNVYFDLQKIDLAEREYKHMVSSNPNYAKYNNKLAHFYFKTKQYRKSIEFLEKSIQMDSNETKFYNNLSIAFYMMKDYDKAINITKKGIEKWKDDLDLLIDLINIYLTIEKLDSAEIYTKKVISKSYELQGLSELYSEWGRKYIQEEKAQLAINAWKKSIEIHPKNYQPYNFLIYYYIHVKLNLDSANHYVKRLKENGGEVDPKINQNP